MSARPEGDPLGKLARAEEHLRQLRQEVDAFVRRKPYRLAIESDSKAGRPADFDIVCIDVNPVPAAVALTAGDFLTNARAALDHLAWNLVLRNGNEPNSHTAFPIKIAPPRKSGSGEAVNLRISGGPSLGAMRMVEAAQPYSRTDGIDAALHPLWVLHRLVGIDKHRHPLLCVQMLDSITFGGHTEDVGGPYRRELEPGTHVTRITFAGSRVKIDVEVATTVGLEEGEPGGGRPLCDVCESLLEAVRAVVDEFGRAFP